MVAARADKLPVVPRALMLAELMRMKRGIAIAGLTARSTTTSLVASVLAEGGLIPPSSSVAVCSPPVPTHGSGTGEFRWRRPMSPTSFLHLSPTLAVITSASTPIMGGDLRP